jgi:tripartite-type tricarboxylate transporter receptor subunit TctC
VYNAGLFAVALGIACAVPSLALAQSALKIAYPDRPIRFIVPYPPGGGSDVIARILAPRLGEGLGQQIVIDNRGGAASMIGLDMLAKSPPNGYTFGIATSTLTVNAALDRKLPFDAARDFAPIMHAVDGLYVLVVHPSVPAKSVNELVALAKSPAAKMNGAIAGSGTPMHLGIVQFNTLTGAKVTPITYKGAGPALTSLLGGETQMAIVSMPTVAAFIQAGRLRAIAVTSERRSAAAPDLPTANEAGLPGFVISGWYGLFAPAGTPAIYINRLNEELRKVLAQSDIKKQLVDFGADIVASTPAEFVRFYRAELAKWAKVVREANIKAE